MWVIKVAACMFKYLCKSYLAVSLQFELAPAFQKNEHLITSLCKL